MIARAWSAQAPNRRLVVTAVAMAIALVVFATGSYHAVGTHSESLARDLLGSWDLVVRPQIALRPRLTDDLATALRADARVARLVRTEVLMVDIEDAADTTYYDSWPATVIAIPDDAALAVLHDGRWPTTSAGADVVEGVLSGGHASRWRVATGDRLPLHAPGGTVTLHVVGTTVERIAHADASGVFVTQATVQRLAGTRTPSDRFYIDLVGDADADAVLADWSRLLADSDPPAEGRDLTGFAREIGMDGAFRRLRLYGAGGAALVLVAALFIVATALGAGADARTRDLALLRTVGATRGQVASLVRREALILAGRAALIGVPIGLILLAGLGAAKRDLFGGPLPPHLPSLLLALVIVGLGVLIAAARPAWRAARTAPLAALRASTPAPAGVPKARSALALVAALVAGLALLPATHTALGTLAAAALAIVALAAAGVLGMPALVLISARLLGPLLARAGGLPGDCLRQHQATGLRRASGIATTLTVCLGASVLLNAWGRSMVTPFLPSPQLSDQVISLLPSGVPPSHADSVRKAPGIIAERVVPLRVEQTFLGRDLILQSGGDPDAFTVQILGCDPQVLLAGGAAPLLPVEAEVAPQALADALAQPLACLIPPTLAQRFGLIPGSTLNILHASGNSEVSLRVGGIAALPGWQWVSKMGRMRTLGDKPMAAILVSDATAAALGIDRVRHWLADTRPDADLQALRRALQVLADTHADPTQAVAAGPVHITKPSVKMIATGEIARRMRERSDAVIWVLGALPLATLLIAMLGVAAAVAAGIRARRAEWALLRAIGLTAPQLRRLILSEVLVVVAAAAVVSVVLGLGAAAAALGASVQAFATGTGTPRLVIPWFDLVVAIAITAVAALAAAWLPARRLAATPPVALLRAAHQDG